jgi:biopolymer transport protein ExbB
VAQALRAGLAREGGTPAWETVEAGVSEALEAAEARQAATVQYINVVAAVAPMVGLLGTVSGMIGAFDTMAAGGMGRPELLAGDIGEAMITTAAGLIIAIPAMVAFFALRDRLNQRMRLASETATAVLDDLRGAAARSA